MGTLMDCIAAIPKRSEVLMNQMEKTSENITKKLSNNYKKVVIIGSGSSYNAGLFIKAFTEKKLNIGVELYFPNDFMKNTNYQLFDKETLLGLINDEMQSNFGLDFSGLGNLMDNLSNHIMQMVKRSEARMVIKNPITYNNLRDYPFASKLTISVVSIISNIFNIKIGLDEFALLVLYLETALQAVATKPTITIGFDSGQSRIESVLFFNEIESRFTDQYTRVLKDKDNTDILVGTRKAQINDYISIQDSLYLDKIQSRINMIRNESINYERYFNDKSVIRDLKGDDKETVLDNLWLELRERNLLKDVEFSSDTLIGLEVGHQVLHLQDYGKAFEHPIFLIAVLERPIIWDNTVVRIIVLIKTKRDGDGDLYKLCSILSDWLNDTDAIVRMIENPGIDVMSKYTIKER